MGAGPCTPWVTEAVLSARPDLANVSVDAGLLTDAATLASQLLYALSGRQWSGACTTKIRPTQDAYGCAGVSGLPGLLARGVPFDSWLAASNGGACCTAGLLLPFYPVRSVSQVKIDGAVLDPTSYRVDDQRWLVRPGFPVFPTWQRLDLDDTHAGTFSVSLSYGADPPAGGILAASALGAELAKSWAGLSSQLPRRITVVAGTGGVAALLDRRDYLKDGLTGLSDVDTWLRSVNPAQQTRPPMVFSPDLPQFRRG